MATIAAANKAYTRGQAARYRGEPFSSNPYKDPHCATNWSLGWIAYGKTRKDKSMPKSIRRQWTGHLRKVK